MRHWKIPGVSLGNPHFLYVTHYCKHYNNRYKLEATKMKVYKRTTLVDDHSSPWSTQVVSTHPHSSSSPLSSSSSLSSLSLTHPHPHPLHHSLRCIPPSRSCVLCQRVLSWGGLGLTLCWRNKPVRMHQITWLCSRGGNSTMQQSGCPLYLIVKSLETRNHVTRNRWMMSKWLESRKGRVPNRRRLWGGISSSTWPVGKANIRDWPSFLIELSSILQI